MVVQVQLQDFTGLIGAMFAINIAFSVWDGIVEKLVAATERRVAHAIHRVMQALDSDAVGVLESGRLSCETEVSEAVNEGQVYGLVVAGVHLVMLAFAGFLPAYEVPVWIVAVLVWGFMLVSMAPLVGTMLVVRGILLKWEDIAMSAKEAMEKDKVRGTAAKLLGGNGA